MVDLDARPAPTEFTERVAVLNMFGMETINLALFRLSDGKVGGSIWGTPVVLLTVAGRRSGRPYTKPLLAMPDGDSWVLVGSRGGTTQHPDWYRNLMAHAAQEETGDIPTADGMALPAPTITSRGGRRTPVRAAVLDGAERSNWWDRLVAVYPKFASYQARSPQRQIPVVRVSPTR